MKTDVDIFVIRLAQHVFVQCVVDQVPQGVDHHWLEPSAWQTQVEG
jgi:hypothetical protein